MWHNDVHFFWGVATLWPRRKGKPTLKKMDKMQRTQLVHESCLRYECLTSHVLNKRVSVSATFYQVTVSFYLLFHSAVAQFADVALYKGNMYKKYTPHSTLSTLVTLQIHYCRKVFCVTAYPCVSTSAPLTYVWAFGFVGCILSFFKCDYHGNCLTCSLTKRCSKPMVSCGDIME